MGGLDSRQNDERRLLGCLQQGTGMSSDFTSEQKRYLEGLVAGLGAMKTLAAPAGTDGAAEPVGPDASHLKAMARFEAEGKKLSDPEKWKREEHPFDSYERLKEHAATNSPPKPPDNFRWRFYGLFYVAPTQDSYMCRLRMPNGILKAGQLAGIADLAERYGGGYAHVTTRANLQMREIAPKHSVAMIEAIQDLGLCSRGSGADNIRNVTGDATAGISKQELLDTRRYTREWHFHILNDRSLYGIPRKFNVAFDGGGRIATLEETNDIGFQAIEVIEGAKDGGQPVDAGVWCRLMIGGITGHEDLASDTGVILRPAEATKVADAILRVFVREGDRANRAKARLKYVLDRYRSETGNLDKFLEAVEEVLGRKLTRTGQAFIKPRPQQDRHAHIGVHPQRQHGLNYIGVVLPGGKMMAAQMREIASIAKELGDGDIRLTVWQNLLISGIPSAKIEEAKARIRHAGFDWKATPVRAGMVACTGNTGCKLANSNTKDTAERIVAHLEAKLDIDQPINIHLTGCPNSCAQHYIGDIGLVGCRVPINDDGDTVEGFHIVAGGGYGPDAAIGKEIYRDVKTEDCAAAVEKLMRVYLAGRLSTNETFQAFARRHNADALRRLADEAKPPRLTVNNLFAALRSSAPS
jgi:ferredoxin-nitrite reductase